jgi:hypothetical protein
VPTYEATDRFWRDFRRMAPHDREAFLVAMRHFVEDLRSRQGFRPGLGVKGVRGAIGVFEMRWADDGRATFEYGREQIPREPHIIWRRIGTHDVFAKP